MQQIATAIRNFQCLTKLMLCDRSVQADLSAKVFDSFTNYGFFCIDVDAENSEIFRRATKAALEFFALPMEHKVPFNVKLRNNKVDCLTTPRPFEMLLS